MNNPAKTCYICKKQFPSTKQFFNSDKSRIDGLHPYCKSCRNKARKDHREANPEIKESARQRASNWYKNNIARAKENGKRNYQENKERYKQNGREWRENNQERYKESNRIRKHTHFRNNREAYNSYTRNRRALLSNANGSHTAEDIRKLHESQNGLCAYCGAPLAGGYHVDHVIPISRGGSNYPSNLALACAFCNCSKNDRLLNEWEPIV
jgi:5-methylcytosine-specific restriction endonuclease McrA